MAVDRSFTRRLAFVGIITLLLATIVVPGGPARAGDVLPPGGTFTDDDGNLHEGMIEAIAAIGVTKGCNAEGTLYCPDDNVSRAQMASFLARALGLPDATQDYFTDDDGNTHEDNINKIAEAGVTLGIGGGLYDPTGLVTRAQMASFLARALVLPDSVTDWFGDDDGNTHEDNINKIADDGVTLGCDNQGNYCPNDFVRRDQMASFIGRALDLTPIVPPPPNGDDTEAPVWPGGAAVTVTGKSDISAVVDWSANPATDDVGVFRYDVYVDGVLDQTVSGTNATITGLSPSTMYTIRVDARDVAGNVSTGNPSVMITTDSLPDTEAPTWPGTPVLTVTGKSDTTMAVDWADGAATDNVGVFEYHVYVDDAFDQTVSATEATVTGLTANTQYMIRVEAADVAGNESTDGPEVTDTTDSTPDTEAPTWPPSPEILETGTTGSTISIDWGANPATDNVSVTEYQVYVNGSPGPLVAGTSTTITGLDDGITYTIRVEARDAAGNESTDGPERMSTTDDTTDPTWTGGVVNETGTSETSISISWSGASDNVGVTAYQVYVDGSPEPGTVAGTSTTITGLMADMTYTIRVEARDAAGNESTDGPEDDFTTDAAAATETITLTSNVFTPDSLTVTVGTEIVFDNTQGNHSLIWENGSYPGHSPASGPPWQETFDADEVGTFDYYCDIHGAAGGIGMSGTLTVDP